MIVLFGSFMETKRMSVLLCGLLMCSCFIVQGSPLSEESAFVMITPAEFVDELAVLQAHKQSHGISTKIVTLDEIFSGAYFPPQGDDAAEQVKYFIAHAHEMWDTMFVLLVGGKELMPVRETRCCFFGENSSEIYVYYFSDLYYADLYDSQGGFCTWDSNDDGIYADKNRSGVVDNVDLYPDVCVGRILTNTESEVSTVVEKIITYENSTAGQSWFHTLVVCGADDARSLLIEAALPFLLGRLGVPVWEGEFLGNAAARILPDFTVKKIYGSGFFRPTVKALTIRNINEAIDEGAGFLMFNGHGSPDCAMVANFPFLRSLWLPYPHQYTGADVAGLSNGFKLPVALFGGCNCGDFNASDSPIAWTFVAHKTGGAIASLACSEGANMLLGSLCTKSFQGHMLMSVFSSYAAGTDQLGELWCDSISNYLNDPQAMALGDAFSQFNWRHTHANHYAIEQWTLFGDPTLKIGGYP
jgi:hypothetical protein